MAEPNDTQDVGHSVAIRDVTAVIAQDPRHWNLKSPPTAPTFPGRGTGIDRDGPPGRVDLISRPSPLCMRAAANEDAEP